jgi:hypothetical protein
MTVQPPITPVRIVYARPPARTRPKPVRPPVAIPVRIVFSPGRKQRDAWKRFMALTGRDEELPTPRSMATTGFRGLYSANPAAGPWMPIFRN